MPTGPAADWTSFSGWGQGTGTGSVREDLLDLISNIDPTDMPFVSQAPKVRMNGPTHSWLTEALAATSTAGAGEGADWALSTTTRPVRESNIPVITRKDIAASESMRAYDNAGFRDAYQREIAKATREIGRNMEAIIWQTTASASGASGTARMLKGMRVWMTVTATSTAVPYGVNASSVNAALGTANFNGMFEQAFLNGAQPEQVFVPTNLKKQISSFTATSQTRNIAAVDKKLVNTIDFYVCDWGIVQVVTDRWIPNPTGTATSASTADTTSTALSNLYFVQRALNRIAFLRPVMHTLIGKRGDSVAGMVLGEWTLEVLNPGGNFKGFNIASA